MRVTASLALLTAELRAQRGRALVLTTCAFLSTLLFALAFHVLFYLRTEVRPHLEALFPEERLIVRAGSKDVAIFRVETARLGEADIDALHAHPAVTRVMPQMPAQFPIMAGVNMGTIDFALETDIVIHGVPRELIARDLEEDVPFEWRPDSLRPVPVAVSSYFLDLYNMGIAESGKLPKLSRAAAIGLRFEITLGESTLGLSSEQTPRTVDAEIVGLTSDPVLAGVAVPIEAVRAWNEEYASESSKYSVLHVDLADPKRLGEVESLIRERGLQSNRASENLDRLRGAVGAVEGLVSGTLAVVLALAAVGFFSTVAMASRDRRGVWGLQRATGMKPGTLAALVVSEGATLGGLGGILGSAGAWAALLLVRSLAGKAIATVTLLPGDPLAIAPLTLVTPVLVGVLFVAIPALLFVLPACAREPATLIGERNL